MNTTGIGGPGIVLALVLAEMAVGGLAVLWLVPAWGNVKMSFFKLIGAVIAACGALAFLAARAPLLGSGSDPQPAVFIEQGQKFSSTPAETAVWLLAAFAVVALLWQIALWVGRPRISRILGIAAVPAGVAALVAVALHPGVANAPPVAVFQLLSGAIFLGAVLDGLLLGHWHLVDRKMTRAPLARTNVYFLAGCAFAAVAVLLGGTGGGEARSDLSPLLGVGVLTVSIAVGLAALCALIGFFIRALIREDSLQSATGLFYLGVIMAFAAEFAAKVRFF